jgi:hypothetical protein
MHSLLFRINVNGELTASAPVPVSLSGLKEFLRTDDDKTVGGAMMRSTENDHSISPQRNRFRPSSALAHSGWGGSVKKRRIERC